MLKTIISSIIFFLTAATALAEDDCSLYQQSSPSLQVIK